MGQKVEPWKDRRTNALPMVQLVELCSCWILHCEDQWEVHEVVEENHVFLVVNVPEIACACLVRVEVQEGRTLPDLDGQVEVKNVLKSQRSLCQTFAQPGNLANLVEKEIDDASCYRRKDLCVENAICRGMEGDLLEESTVDVQDYEGPKLEHLNFESDHCPDTKF